MPKDIKSHKRRAIKRTLELEYGQELEIIKAMAQASYRHSGSSKIMNEFYAHKKNFKGKSSRFKLEAMKNSTATSSTSSSTWDFKRSLWHSYEIVTLSKRLETELVFDKPIFTELDALFRVRMKPKESKKSLRDLFNQMSYYLFFLVSLQPDLC